VRSWTSRSTENTPSPSRIDRLWAPGYSNSSRRLERAEAARFLHSALRVLPPQTRQVIVLRDLRGLDYQEIAASLGIPEGTVKSRLNRGRRELALVIYRRLKRRQMPARYQPEKARQLDTMRIMVAAQAS